MKLTQKIPKVGKVLLFNFEKDKIDEVWGAFSKILPYKTTMK